MTDSSKAVEKYRKMPNIVTFYSKKLPITVITVKAFYSFLWQSNNLMITYKVNSLSVSLQVYQHQLHLQFVKQTS
jgi:branched-subunit amino acid transport protein AzlD